MTLPERIVALKRRAEEQLVRQTGFDEAQKLQLLRNEARPLSQGVGSEVAQLRLLRDQGITLPEAVAGADAGTARTTLDQLRTRFAADRRAARLTQGQGWTRFKEKTEAARTQAASSLDQSWRDFVASAYSGDKPGDLEQRLALTDVNMERLSRYRTAYEELGRLSRRRPTGREDFERVRDLARQLHEIHLGFVSAPDAVTRFLRAIAAGGADLDLLTDEVRAWLEKQGSTSRYQIVARRSAQ